MSANYWDSTQRKYWLFSKDELADMRQKLEDDNAELIQMFPLKQVRHLYIYFNQRRPSNPDPDPDPFASIVLSFRPNNAPLTIPPATQK
jgi:hypothetical protein